MATLVTLSTLALGLSAMNTLIIRDAAIEAANRAALAEGQGQKRYLMKLLDDRLPALASYEIQEQITDSLIGYDVVAQLPGAGVVPFTQAGVSVVVSREVFL